MARSLQFPTMLVALAVGTVLLVAGPPPAAAVDEVYLTSGGRLTGDLQDTDLVLVTPHVSYRVTRETVWRITLETGTLGDKIYLRNGNRLSGRLDHAAYTVRLANGEARRVARGEVAVITLGVPGSRQGQRTDTVLLKSGDVVYGDVTAQEFDITLASGTQRFPRQSLWRIWLDSSNGDGVQLVNGNQLAGIVEAPGYDVRTPDGQTVRFWREDVKEIVLRLPERPKAAAPEPPVTAAVTPPSATTPPPTGPALPPSALPPAVRAVLRDLHFEFDRWDLTAEARQTLEDMAGALRAYPTLRLLIEGHADERGTAEYNLALGARRAQAAKDYLAGLGIDAGRLETISYGEERPLDPGHNEMAWALNRRAHFLVKQ